MRKGFLILALSAGLVVTNLVATKPAIKVYGEGITGSDLTEIAVILGNPESFEGRTVRVRGKVVEVCQQMGCWMDIEDSSGRIQIKVDDGVIVFPATAVGKEATAEGKVEVRTLSKEQYIGWLEHLAEEKGETFDPVSVGDPPYRIVRIRGAGAEIEE